MQKQVRRLEARLCIAGDEALSLASVDEESGNVSEDMSEDTSDEDYEPDGDDDDDDDDDGSDVDDVGDDRSSSSSAVDSDSNADVATTAAVASAALVAPEDAVVAINEDIAVVSVELDANGGLRTRVSITQAAAGATVPHVKGPDVGTLAATRARESNNLTDAEAVSMFDKSSHFSSVSIKDDNPAGLDIDLFCSLFRDSAKGDYTTRFRVFIAYLLSERVCSAKKIRKLIEYVCGASVST